MAKIITEAFEIKREGYYNGRIIKIVASNQEKTMVEFSGWDSVAKLSISTADMKELGLFLIETSAKIDSDPLFKRENKA